jgi:predicted nucleic acid-binding protein
VLDPGVLPRFPEITTITLADLHHGVAAAKDAVSRAVRTERLGTAITDFDALPFDDHAAARYGTLVSLTLEANRDPKPRMLDLMIAATASSHGLPLYTRNAADFRGLGDMVSIIAV